MNPMTRDNIHRLFISVYILAHASVCSFVSSDPITVIGVLTIIILAYLLVKNKTEPSKLIGFFLPLIVVMGITMGGIFWSNNKLKDFPSPISIDYSSTPPDKEQRKKVSEVTVKYDTK